LNQPVLKSSLSKRQAQFVELCQKHPHCIVEGLHLHLGEPDFSTEPKVVEKLKMGANNSRRPESGLPDFWLKQPMVELLETIAELSEGVITRITIIHGLPHLVEIERTPFKGESTHA
jgi:hypothetical protein